MDRGDGHHEVCGTALVVCQHDPTRERLTSVVESAGLAAIEAADAERALYLAGEHAVDAVVIALTLPGMGAEELCSELRRRGRIAILVLSGGGKRRRLAALEAGADDHVDVPFHATEVQARLRALVRRTAGPLAVERAVRLGPVVVRVIRGQGIVDGVDDPLGPEVATVLGALAERVGCVVGSDALRDRLAERHGREAARHLEEHVEALAGFLAAAGAPSLHPVDDLGYVLQP